MRRPVSILPAVNSALRAGTAAASRQTYPRHLLAHEAQVLVDLVHLGLNVVEIGKRGPVFEMGRDWSRG